jgi:hypothetical protein
MSYSWTGPPAQFNGTDATTGGDSGMYNYPANDRAIHPHLRDHSGNRSRATSKARVLTFGNSH